MLNRTSRLYIAAALGALTVPMPAQAASPATTTHPQAGLAAGRSPTQGDVLPRGRAPLRLVALPTNPVTGEQVRFVVLTASPMAAEYKWDLTGRDTYLFDTASSPRMSERFAMPGSYRVTVRVTNGLLTREATMTISVRDRRGMHPGGGPGKLMSRGGARKEKTPTGRQNVAISGNATPVPSVRRLRGVNVNRGGIGKLTSVAGAPPGDTPIGPQSSDASSNPTLVLRMHRRRRASPVRHGPVNLARAAGTSKRETSIRVQSAHAASDPGVTIADFQFTPSSTTVHVGDTVTWTNNGPSSHTATARDGSFDSGILKKGESASHAFTRPGTYAFYCKIHPFMHSTIIVLAAATSTTPSTGSKAKSTSSPGPSSPDSTTSATPSSTGKPASAPTATSDQALPMTGFNIVTGLLCGLVLFGFGLTLRRLLGR